MIRLNTFVLLLMSAADEKPLPSFPVAGTGEPESQKLNK